MVCISDPIAIIYYFMESVSVQPEGTICFSLGFPLFGKPAVPKTTDDLFGAMGSMERKVNLSSNHTSLLPLAYCEKRFASDGRPTKLFIVYWRSLNDFLRYRRLQE